GRALGSLGNLGTHGTRGSLHEHPNGVPRHTTCRAWTERLLPPGKILRWTAHNGLRPIVRFRGLLEAQTGLLANAGINWIDAAASGLHGSAGLTARHCIRVRSIPPFGALRRRQSHRCRHARRVLELAWLRFFLASRCSFLLGLLLDFLQRLVGRGGGRDLLGRGWERGVLSCRRAPRPPHFA